MQTKIEVEKTYWVGMTEEQKHDLMSALIILTDPKEEVRLDPDQLEVLDDLRLSLLNT